MGLNWNTVGLFQVKGLAWTTILNRLWTMDFEVAKAS